MRRAPDKRWTGVLGARPRRTRAAFGRRAGGTRRAPGVRSPGARAAERDVTALREVPLPRPHGHREGVAGRREGQRKNGEKAHGGSSARLRSTATEPPAPGAGVRGNPNRYPPSAAARSPAPVASAKTARTPPPASTVSCTVTPWPPRVKARSPPSPSPRWCPSAMTTRTVRVSGYGVNAPAVRAAGPSGRRAILGAARSRPDSARPDRPQALAPRTGARPARRGRPRAAPGRRRGGRCPPAGGRRGGARRLRWRSSRGGPRRAATAPGWPEVVLPENRPASGHR